MTTPLDGLHAKLYALVEQRHFNRPGPRFDLLPMQVIRLAAIKLIEQTLEAATSVALPRELSTPIDLLSTEARHLFRYRGWLAQQWTARHPSPLTLQQLKSELADVYIVLAHLEGVLNALTGEEWDIQTEALNKALADLTRQ